MRVIKIPANGDDLTELDIDPGFPAVNIALLGSANSLIEQVYAKGLLVLTERVRPLDVVMLVDEEGLYVPDPILNLRASWLYGTHVYGNPIMGDAFIVAGDIENWVSLPETIAIVNVIDACQSAATDHRLFLR